MDLTSFNSLNLFKEELVSREKEINEKELKIILSLSDLLDFPQKNENDFIKESLIFLKENHRLTKSVWHGLLKLNDLVPDFTHKLSCWNTQLESSFESRDYLIKVYIPIEKCGLAVSKRVQNINKLFHLIDILVKNFGLDIACDSIGLLVPLFDTQRSPFSINNLNKIKNTSDTEINYGQIYLLENYYFYWYTIPMPLKSLTYFYQDKDKNKSYRNLALEKSLKRNLDDIGLPTDNILETFNKVVSTYKKYTQEDFISYNGLIEIKTREIAKEDKEIITALLKNFDEPEFSSLAYQKIIVEFIRLTNKYNNDVLKGIEKRSFLIDYVTRSQDIKVRLKNQSDFRLNDLLTWSNKWHMTGDSRGEKIEFKKHDINLTHKGYIFEQLTNSHQLHEEGVMQSHCVYSYTKDCESGQYVIVSMKGLKGKNISTVCFEKREKSSLFFSRKKSSIWTIQQNRKKLNKSCSPEEQAIVEDYFNLIESRLN